MINTEINFDVSSGFLWFPVRYPYNVAVSKIPYNCEIFFLRSSKDMFYKIILSWSDVYFRPLPLNWNYHANLSFRPYKIPVVAGTVTAGAAAVTKSKTKEISSKADDSEDAEENVSNEDEKSNDVKDEEWFKRISILICSFFYLYIGETWIYFILKINKCRIFSKALEILTNLYFFFRKLQRTSEN